MALGWKAGVIGDCWSGRFLSPVNEGVASIDFPRLLPRPLLMAALALAMDGLLHRTTRNCRLECEKCVTYLAKETCRSSACRGGRQYIYAWLLLNHKRKGFMNVDLCS